MLMADTVNMTDSNKLVTSGLVNDVDAILGFHDN